MNDSLAAITAITTKAFSIDAYNVALAVSSNALNPGQKAPLQCQRIQGCKDAVESVMAGNAIRQFNVLTKPGLLALAIKFDIIPVITAT